MNSPKRLTALGVALLVSAGTAMADSAPAGDVQGELSALKARIAELEGKQNQSWLNERRAEEVKALVREVLADADTRASLLENGLSAGHNGKNFFLASEDGNFLLTIGGQLDFRYYANFRDDADDDVDVLNDDGLAGFQTGHTQIDFVGHVGSPRFGYNVRLGIDPTDNSVNALRAYVTYALTDTLTIWLGEREAPFLREELTENSYITSVERSVFNEVFTMGVVQGIGLEWQAHEAVRIAASLNDGFSSGEYGEVFGFDDDDFIGIKPYYSDGVDFAVTARIDVKLAGDWSQMKDFAAWSGEEFAAFVGGAVHYEHGETGSPLDNNNFWAWTVDGSIESNGFSLFGALTGVHTDLEDGDDVDAYGYLIEGAYNINDKYQPFIRYEKIHFDGDDFSNSNQFVTAGVNWFINKHRAKATFDVLWSLNPIDSGSEGILTSRSANGGPLLGLLPDGDSDSDDQVVLRGKFQLMF